MHSVGTLLCRGVVAATGYGVTSVQQSTLSCSWSIWPPCHYCYVHHSYVWQHAGESCRLLFNSRAHGATKAAADARR